MEEIASSINSLLSFVTNHMVELSSFFVAAATFYVSWLSYKRDSGRLDVFVTVGEMRKGQTLALEQIGLHIKIVNSGRRPLIVTSVGGDAKWQFVSRIAFRLLGFRTPGWLKPRAFLVNDPLVTTHLMTGGRYKTLHEGEDISVFLPFPQGKGLLKYIATECSNFYVFDSVGRKHKTSCAVMRKIKNDFFESHAED